MISESTADMIADIGLHTFNPKFSNGMTINQMLRTPYEKWAIHSADSVSGYAKCVPLLQLLILAFQNESINYQNLYTNCNRGTINYSGSASAGAEIQQLQGKTVLTMDGRQADYTYSLDLDLGHIGIGDQEYAGPHQDQSIDNSAEKTIDASCTMGSIRILFSQAS